MDIYKQLNIELLKQLDKIYKNEALAQRLNISVRTYFRFKKTGAIPRKYQETIKNIYNESINWRIK